MNAGYNGNADCVRLLLDAGADKNATNVVRGRSTASLVGRVYLLLAKASFCLHLELFFVSILNANSRSKSIHVDSRFVFS